MTDTAVGTLCFSCRQQVPDGYLRLFVPEGAALTCLVFCGWACLAATATSTAWAEEEDAEDAG